MRILMTGGTAGLGKAALEWMLNRAWHVVVVCRNEGRANELQCFFKQHNPSGKLETVIGDLASFKSLKWTVAQLHSKYESFDQFIYNAGVYKPQLELTEDGIETTFQVNFLSLVLLTQEIMPLLQLSDQPRIIYTASGLYQGKIDFSDIERRTGYSGFKAYRQSKLALILYARFLVSQSGGNAPMIVCQHPGLVATSLGRDSNPLVNSFFRLFGKSSVEGAKNLIFLMESPLKKLHAGAFYKDKEICKTSAYSYDMQVGKRLFVLSQSYLKKHYYQMDVERR